MAAIFHPVGVRVNTISSAPAESTARPRYSPRVVLVDVAQPTSPRTTTRTDPRTPLTAREGDVGRQVVRAVLVAGLDAATLQDHRVRGEQRERGGAVAGGECPVVLRHGRRDRRRVTPLPAGGQALAVSRPGAPPADRRDGNDERRRLDVPVGARVQLGAGCDEERGRHQPEVVGEGERCGDGQRGGGRHRGSDGGAETRRSHAGVGAKGEVHAGDGPCGRARDFTIRKKNSAQGAPGTSGPSSAGATRRGGRNPAIVTATSRRTAALDGRVPAAARA